MMMAMVRCEFNVLFHGMQSVVSSNARSLWKFVCAHTRLTGLPKVAKSRGKRGRPAATTATTSTWALIGYNAVPSVYIGR